MDETAAPTTDLLTQWIEKAYGAVRIIDGRTYVAPLHTPNRIFELTHKQQSLLYHLSKENDLEKASEKAGISVNTARAFIRSRDYADLQTEAMNVIGVVTGFTPIRVLYETIRQFKGEIQLTDSQNKALDRLERILIPKKQDAGISAGTLNVQVNNFPNLPPDMVEKLKALGDARAIEENAA